MPVGWRSNSTQQPGPRDHATARSAAPPRHRQQAHVIHVRQGKGQKDRFVPLSPSVLSILREHFRIARPRDCLFCGQREGRSITHSAIQRFVKRVECGRHREAPDAALPATLVGARGDQESDRSARGLRRVAPMARPPFDVPDVIRAHAEVYAQAHGGVASSGRRRVMRRLTACRTAAPPRAAGPLLRHG